MNNLEVKELSVFAGTKKILNNLSFTATGGMLVSILGGNGAGENKPVKSPCWPY
jgi:ABC-type cobalamin/Fe3+-siderophores transport system ATPase subunit